MKYLFNPPVDGSVLTLADETIRKGQIVELPEAVAARLLAKVPPYIVAADPPAEAKPGAKARKPAAAKPPAPVEPEPDPESDEAPPAPKRKRKPAEVAPPAPVDPEGEGA